MPTSQHSKFSSAIRQLELLRSQIVDELRRQDESRLETKLQLDDAIRCLKFCEVNGIATSCTVIRLPQTQTRTPSSQYRIIEDHESDDRSDWTEIRIGGVDLRPLPGTLLLEHGQEPQHPV